MIYSDFILENTSDEWNMHIAKRSSWSAQIQVEFQVDREINWRLHFVSGTLNILQELINIGVQSS